MTTETQTDTPGMGHNNPPLADLLVDETAEIRARVDVLVEQAGKAVVTDEETAQKTTLLAGMIRDQMKTIEQAREKRKAPYLQAGREIDTFYGNLAGQLAIVDNRKLTGGPLFRLMTLIDEYRREQERLAEIERRRLEAQAAEQRRIAEEEARKAREAEERRQREAAEAQRKIEAANAAAAAAATAEAREKARREAAEQQLAQEQAEHKAAEERRAENARLEDAVAKEGQLQRQAEATTTTPIRTAYGVSAHRRTTYKVEITDIRKALGHCLRINPEAVKAFVTQMYEAQVRAKVRMLPGATVTEDSATTVRTK